MNQPLIGDEVIFLESAKGILKTGKPIFDHGVLRPNFQGLWHPPLYSYVLSLFMLLFGESIYSLRAVSALFNFFTAILVFLITKEILKKNENKEFWALFATALYSLNPLTIQSSILMDIDGGILNFTIYLFLYFFIKNKRFYYLIPSLVFIFLAKESGPVIIFISLILFYLITSDYKKIFKIAFLFIFSGIIFASLFWIYCNLFNLDFMMPFKHNFGKGTQSINLDTIAGSLWSLKSFVYFAIPFFVLLFFFLFICFVIINYKSLNFLNSTKKNVLFLGIFSIITIAFFVYYGVTSWGFPKYYITALPAMSIFISYLFSYSNLKIKTYWKFFVLIILLLIYFGFFILNPLFPEFDSSVGDTSFLNAGKLVANTFILYAIIPIIISFFVLQINSKKRYIKNILLVLIFLTFFMFFYLNIINAFADYSTHNKYGDKGVLDVVEYLNKKNIPPSKIATYLHLGYYLGMSEFNDIAMSYYSNEDFKKNIINNEQIEYMVIWIRDIKRIGLNMGYFKLEKKIGTYYIFKKR